MPHRPKPDRAFNRFKPFTRGEALRAGISDATLATGEFQQLLWGVHVAATVKATLEVRSRAALLIAPDGAVLTHHTAAALWDGVVPDSADLWVGVARSQRMLTEGVSVRRYTSPPPRTRRRGLPVTTPERTFVDLAAQLNLVDLVVLGDSLVKAAATTPEALVDAAGEFHGRGARLARRAASLVRSGVDSPMESRLRLLLVLAGLPEPVVDHRICSRNGAVIYRIDLSFPKLKIAIEYDGRHHIEREPQWRGDLARREQLEGDGWRFVVVLAQDVYSTPDRTLARVLAAVRERGGEAALRRREWVRYFPGRPSAA
jgi:Protein of unknown function (DUF559)